MPPVTILPTDNIFRVDCGELWVLGEIQNNKRNGISFLKVTANVFDSANRLLDTESTYPEPFSGMPPGQRTCFRVRFDADPPGRAYHRYEISYDDASSTRALLGTINLSSRFIPRHDDKHDLEIVGQVKNENSFAVEYAQVVGTARNKAGRVVGCGYSYASVTDLAPGQMSAFKLEYSGYNRDYADVGSYRLLAMGNRK